MSTHADLEAMLKHAVRERMDCHARITIVLQTDKGVAVQEANISLDTLRADDGHKAAAQMLAHLYGSLSGMVL